MGNISGRIRRGHMMLGEAGPCTLGVISWPSNCSQDDAVCLWKAACVRECHGSQAAQGPDTYSGLDSLTQLYFGISLLWDSVPNTSYSISSIFLFLYLMFSLNTSPPAPHSIHCCILTSICCFPGIPWLVFVFLLGLLGPYSLMVCCLMFHTLLPQLLE